MISFPFSIISIGKLTQHTRIPQKERHHVTPLKTKDNYLILLFCHDQWALTHTTTEIQRMMYVSFLAVEEMIKKILFLWVVIFVAVVVVSCDSMQTYGKRQLYLSFLWVFRKMLYWWWMHCFGVSFFLHYVLRFSWCKGTLVIHLIQKCFGACLEEFKISLVIKLNKNE